MAEVVKKKYQKYHVVRPGLVDQAVDSLLGMITFGPSMIIFMLSYLMVSAICYFTSLSESAITQPLLFNGKKKMKKSSVKY